VLNNNGHKCIIIDANAENLSLNDILKRLRKNKIELVGFSIYCLTLLDQLPLIRKIKNETNLPVVVGGSDVKYFANSIIKYQEIDYLIQGNALDALRFVNAFESGKDLDKVNSLVYKKRGKIITNNFVQNRKDFLKYSLPDWSLLKTNLYYNLFVPSSFATIMGSIGCPHNCLFCVQGNCKVYFRPVKEIINELKQLKKLNVSFIEFLDNTMTLNKKWIIQLCKEIINNKLNIKFIIETRIQSINKEILKYLKKAGCIQINFGIESGDKKIQKVIRKNLDFKKVKQVIQLTNEYNLQSLGYFTLGHPQENKKTLTNTLKLAKDLPLTFAIFMKIVPYIGSDLYRLYVRERGIYWEDYVCGNKKEKIGFVGNDLSHTFLDSFIYYAYRQFYYRPSQIMRIVKQINSFNQFKRFIKSGVDILLK